MAEETLSEGVVVEKTHSCHCPWPFPVSESDSEKSPSRILLETRPWHVHGKRRIYDSIPARLVVVNTNFFIHAPREMESAKKEFHEKVEKKDEPKNDTPNNNNNTKNDGEVVAEVVDGRDKGEIILPFLEFFIRKLEGNKLFKGNFDDLHPHTQKKVLLWLSWISCPLCGPPFRGVFSKRNITQNWDMTPKVLLEFWQTHCSKTIEELNIHFPDEFRGKKVEPLPTKEVIRERVSNLDPNADVTLADYAHAGMTMRQFAAIRKSFLEPSRNKRKHSPPLSPDEEPVVKKQKFQELFEITKALATTAGSEKIVQDAKQKFHQFTEDNTDLVQ